MDSPISAITKLALAAAGQTFDQSAVPDPWRSFGDPTLSQLASIEFPRIEQSPAFEEVVAELGRDPELAPLLPRDGELDPFIMSPGAGGSRVNFRGVVTTLLSNAARLLLAQGKEHTDTAFVRAVLESYEELKRAARGEAVRSYAVRGLAGISLDDDVQITTPWGTIRGVNREPSPPQFMTQPKPETSALLVTPQLTQLHISREREPTNPDPDPAIAAARQRIQTLTPLLFALWSLEAASLAAPVVTFETTILPLFAGFGFSTPLYMRSHIPVSAIERDQVKTIEDLAVTLTDNYDENMQLASIRAVQAISQRTDRSDALIDAVMAWENLVGTRSETVYRLTAGLARLLEPDNGNRRAFRKELQDIYNVRSRLVHGDVVEPQKIQTASEQAIRVALRAMLEIYQRGGDWITMSSNDRSETLILGDS